MECMNIHFTFQGSNYCENWFSCQNSCCKKPVACTWSVPYKHDCMYQKHLTFLYGKIWDLFFLKNRYALTWHLQYMDIHLHLSQRQNEMYRRHSTLADHQNVTFIAETSYSPVEKGQIWLAGRSRVCPKCFCGLLFTGMCTFSVDIMRVPSQTLISP